MDMRTSGMEERDIQDRGSKVTEGTPTGYPFRIKQRSEHI